MLEVNEGDQIFALVEEIEKRAAPKTVKMKAVTTQFDDETVLLPATRLPWFQWRSEYVLIAALLLIAALAHSINMFNYPFYHDDEGTYISQAWAIINEGKLAPYTYWYDHAPAGWTLLALWSVITGGVHTFGSAINSGRVLMLLLQIGSTAMLYLLAQRIARSTVIAIIATLIFALSPYGLYYHRRVLLDNICTFWMLASMLLLFRKRFSLTNAWLSALALGLSILSKEVTVFLIPAMAYLVFLRANASNRWLATCGWLTLVGFMLSLYVLMAMLKGELFPVGTLFGGTHAHVSLIGTLQYQASRGSDGGLFDLKSAFWSSIYHWSQDDPMLVVGGTISALLSVAAIRWNRIVGVMGLLTLSLYIFLARGGEILGFYLVPLLPLLALNAALLIGETTKILEKLSLRWLKKTIIVRYTFQASMMLVCALALSGGYASPNPGFQNDHFTLWNNSQSEAQNQATLWIKQHVSAQSYILIDDFMWTDLHDVGNSPQSYRYAHYYWKVDRDPEIRIGVFHNDWHNVDYIVTTRDMTADAKGTNMVLVENALAHSTLLAHFDTGGWPIDILKVNK